MGKLEGDAASALLVRALEGWRVASGDVKALMHAVYPSDSSVAPAVNEDGSPFDPALCNPANLFDTGVAAYLLDSSKGSYPVAEVAERYLEGELPEATDAVPTAAVAATASRVLVPVLREALERDGSAQLMDQMEMPLVGVLARMERMGLAVDPEVLAAQSRELGADIEESRQKIFAAAGREFNVDSPMQLSGVLFDDLGLPTAGLKKTQRGYYSTNAKVLEDLARTNDVVAEVLAYR